MGSHEGHAVQLPQIAHQGPGQGGALLGIGAPGELIQGHEEELSPALPEQLIQQVDLPAEGGQAAGAGAAVGQDQRHPVKQGQGGGLGKHEEAALAQEQGEHGGAQGDGLAAHVGAGNDRAAGAQLQLQGGELLPARAQLLRHLGVNHAPERDGLVGAEGRADAMEAQGQLGLGHDEIQVAKGLHIGQEFRFPDHELFGEHLPHRQLQLVLFHRQHTALLQQGAAPVLLGHADSLLQLGLFRPQGGEIVVVGVDDGEGGQPPALGIHQLQSVGQGGKYNARHGGHLVIGLGELFQGDQEVLELKELHQIEGGAGLPVEGAADVVEQGQAAGHTPQSRRRILALGGIQPGGLASAFLSCLGDGAAGGPQLHGQGHVVQLLLQLGLLSGAVPPGGASGLLAKGRQGAQALQHPLKSRILPQFMGQFHAQSSFTFTTGRSMISRRAATNLSGSKCQP